MGDSIDLFVLLHWILHGNKIRYQILAMVSPFAIAFIISPEKFPDNIIYSLVLIAFYTSTFILIYRIYFNEKKKIKKKIRDNIYPKVNKNKIKVETLKQNLIEFRNASIDKNSNLKYESKIVKNHIMKIYTLYTIKKSDTYIRKTDELLQTLENAGYKIEVINRNGGEGNEKFNYKHFDYTLMFVGSLILALRFIISLEIISNNFVFGLLNSTGLIFIYLVVILLYTILEYLNYIKIEILVKLFLFLLTRVNRSLYPLSS
ncbi:MAG: hypothetical protein KAI84_20005 [Gammaproteobacteria bacterium]|nr:hypothetical protein [Gammaproteobacteria bacterium]